MNPNRTYEENMAALKKVLTQRTYTALSHRNIEFVLKYQNASLQELAAYLRRQQAELRHIPGRTEIIGGDFIELRFRGWVTESRSGIFTGAISTPAAGQYLRVIVQNGEMSPYMFVIV